MMDIYYSPISDEVTVKQSANAIRISKDEHKQYFLDEPPQNKMRKQCCYPFAFEDCPEDNFSHLERAAIEHSWAQVELSNTQIELMYHWTDDRRAKATEAEWKQYARDLRDYTSTNENGTPYKSEDARPQKPL